MPPAWRCVGSLADLLALAAFDGLRCSPYAEAVTSAGGAEVSVGELLHRQVRHVTIAIGLTVLAGVPVLVVIETTERLNGLSLLYLVALVGTVGGNANNVRHLQRLSEQPDDGELEVDPILATAQIYLSPIIGGVFAVLLYGIFMSGLIKGDFFPFFECGATVFEGDERLNTFADCSPHRHSDVAKAFVWSFVAGFGERFVPNILDGLGRPSSN